jgi:hypothetical protein
LKKLLVASALLLLFGIALSLLSYSNFYSFKTEPIDSGTVPVAADSSNEHGFYVGIDLT